MTLATEQEHRFLSKGDELRKHLRQLKAKQQALNEEYVTFVEENANLELELQDCKQNSFQLVSKLQQLNAELDTVTRNLQQAEARRESQQELDDSYAS